MSNDMSLDLGLNCLHVLPTADTGKTLRVKKGFFLFSLVDNDKTVQTRVTTQNW